MAKYIDPMGSHCLTQKLKYCVVNHLSVSDAAFVGDLSVLSDNKLVTPRVETGMCVTYFLRCLNDE